MKKGLLIFILVFSFCFSACGKTDVTKDVQSEKETTTYEILENVTSDKKPQVENETEVLTEPEEDEIKNLPLPQENMLFSFLSGAGGWMTEMYLNSDGTFSGVYTDSELGSTGEGYPKGTYYVSDFSGRFINFEKINEYSYRMEIADVQVMNTPGQEWIDDSTLFIASEPYGIEEGKEFILYLPDTPVSEMNEEFLMWWPYRFDEGADAKNTLSCYGILNVDTNYGFFTYNG